MKITGSAGAYSIARRTYAWDTGWGAWSTICNMITYSSCLGANIYPTATGLIFQGGNYSSVFIPWLN